jgi:dipeptidyl aminopeptidase/acylaminoacyl peptidase
VALYPATDLVGFATGSGGANALLSLYMGAYLGSGPALDPPSKEAISYREASPVAHVSRDDAPFLLVHGDADTAVPWSQSERLHTELTRHGVAVRFITMPGGGHGAAISAGPNPPDYLGPMVEWFDRHLQGTAGR